MLLRSLRAKSHLPSVTRVDLQYEGSIAIDEVLTEAAEILPYEAVHVWNIANGKASKCMRWLRPGDQDRYV